MGILKSTIKSTIKPVIHGVFGEDEHAITANNLLLENGFDLLLEDGGLFIIE